jgi:hypothetical protein
MGSMLDAIAALVIGGMILISIFNTMFNVNFLGHDLNTEFSLMKTAEQIVAGIDTLYLAKVGSGMGTSTGILEATSNKFKFEHKVSPESTDEDEICIVQETKDTNGYPLKVYRNDTLELGPFWLADSLKFTYYTKSGNVTTNLDSVRSVKVKMNFTYDYLSSGQSGRKVRYDTTFWRYFENLYLI